MVKDGKVYCTVHADTAEIDKWNEHEDRTAHTIQTLPMRHVLYVAAYCTTCNMGKVLIDEEQ